MPTNAERKRSEAALNSFHTYYGAASNWGQERWQDSLYPALCQPTRYAAVVNRFVSEDHANSALRMQNFGGSELVSVQSVLQELRLPALQSSATTERNRDMLILEQILPNAARDESVSKSSLFPPPSAAPSVVDPTKQLLTHWNLDAASALCAHMLDVQPGHRVLDLCAAPGGKSVALAQLLFPRLQGDSAGTARDGMCEAGCLHSNEMDNQRNRRLLNNLRSYLPGGLFSAGIVKVFQLDGTDPKTLTTLPHGHGQYDRVLLDAPCSSERHIVQAHVRAASAGHIAEEMARWRPGSSKNIAKIQVSLLMMALKAVKLSGRVVYSTCSISSEENDGVVEKMLLLLEKERKKGTCAWSVRIELGKKGAGGMVADITRLDELSEATEYGRIVVSDHGDGRWGPLFFCVLTKVAV